MKTHEVLRTIDKKSRVDETATPMAKSGEILVEPLFVGVCGTDLQIIRRQRPDPAEILGHEGIARVVAGNDFGKGISEGDYVVFNPVDPTDQNQVLGHNIPGLLQKRYLVTQHAIENDLIVPFSDRANSMVGALVEPLGTVIYGHRLASKVVVQSSIVIVGAGAIGIMHALYARTQGYKKVILVNASEQHLEWCIQRKIIKRENTFLDSETLPEEIIAATGGLGPDAIYMCTSRPNALQALERAVEYIKPNGCIDLVGGIKDDDQIDRLPLVKDLNAIRRANFCGRPVEGSVERVKSNDGKSFYLTGHRGTSLDHLKAAITSLQAHSDIFSKVISHIVSFEAAADLFDQLANNNLRELNGAPYIKAIVDMQLKGKVIKNV